MHKGPEITSSTIELGLLLEKGSICTHLFSHFLSACPEQTGMDKLFVFALDLRMGQEDEPLAQEWAKMNHVSGVDLPIATHQEKSLALMLRTTCGTAVSQPLCLSA